MVIITVRCGGVNKAIMLVIFVGAYTATIRLRHGGEYIAIW
jgi:hypothetical protein